MISDRDNYNHFFIISNDCKGAIIPDIVALLLYFAVFLSVDFSLSHKRSFGFSWKISKLERLQYVQPEESHYRQRETEWTREHVNGDKGTIFGQLYNWLLIQCSLHIKDSPSPSTLWLISCSCNKNKSIPQWKCILTTDSLVLSFLFISSFCLFFLLAFFF